MAVRTMAAKRRSPSEVPFPDGKALAARLARLRQAVDGALPRFVPSGRVCPAVLRKAMEYSLLAGGKRLRPILCLAAAEAAGGSVRAALPVACALEFIHTYSLIHDDLPAMDDDDLRRGHPTNHRVFGEATAILAGDALLTAAFGIIAGARGIPPAARLAIVAEVAGAAGAAGMVGGQIRDMAAEGKGAAAGKAEVAAIHRAKTGALITASLRAGALSAGAGPALIRRLTTYGRHLGSAFQIVDDLLDVEGDEAVMGKTPGSDGRRHKATYPSAVGLETARREALAESRRALRALRGLGREAGLLAGIVGVVLERRS
jgi:geranylgeranyl diphosphate synthase type II